MANPIGWKEGLKKLYWFPRDWEISSKYSKILKAQKRAGYIIGYHGTDKTAAKKILSEGFRGFEKARPDETYFSSYKRYATPYAAARAKDRASYIFRVKIPIDAKIGTGGMDLGREFTVTGGLGKQHIDRVYIRSLQGKARAIRFGKPNISNDTLFGRNKIRHNIGD